MGTDNFSAPASPASSSVTGPASGSVAGPALGYGTGPAPSFVAGSTLDSVTSPASGSVVCPTPDSVTSAAPSDVAGHVVLVVIDSTKGNYFYRKQVMTEDLTSFKLYMKGTIWIRGILFGKTSKAWNYMFGIPDNPQRAELAKDLGHQFIFLAKKMGDGYQQFFDLVKCTWKETGMAKDIMTGIITRLCPHITANKKKGVFCSKILAAIDKYWPGVGFYKRFY